MAMIHDVNVSRQVHLKKYYLCLISQVYPQMKLLVVDHLILLFHFLERKYILIIYEIINCFYDENFINLCLNKF